MIMQILNGFCMALADSVPGVSGGTIAFLLGFYDKFITAIDDLITGNMEKKKVAFVFLIKLGIGWVLGFISAVLVLTRVFESHIYAISSLFIGFIIFAIPVVIREEKESLGQNKKYLFFVLIGMAIVSAITYFNPISGGEGMSFDNFSFGLGVYLFLAGAVAISAMVLPGISGSTSTGRNVVLGGQCGSAGHLHIGDFTQVGARGAISKSLPANGKFSGHPILPIQDWLKLQALLKRMLKK